MRQFLLLICFCTFVTEVNSQIRLPEKPDNPRYINYLENVTGFWGAIEASGGSMADTRKRNIQFGGTAAVAGYRFNDYLRLGIGFGVKYYFPNSDVRKSDNAWVFPLYADIRGNFISQDIRTLVPYWSVDIGAELNNGLFFSPTLGIRVGQRRSSFLLGVSYKIVSMDTMTKNDEVRNLFELKLGYEF